MIITNRKGNGIWEQISEENMKNWRTSLKSKMPTYNIGVDPVGNVVENSDVYKTGTVTSTSSPETAYTPATPIPFSGEPGTTGTVYRQDPSGNFIPEGPVETSGSGTQYIPTENWTFRFPLTPDGILTTSGGGSTIVNGISQPQANSVDEITVRINIDNLTNELVQEELRMTYASNGFKLLSDDEISEIYDKYYDMIYKNKM